jgi:hypothetical protein
MTLTAAWLVPVSVRAAAAAQPYWVQIVEIIILADVGVYFAHRMFHAVPWLWRFHAIHHSSEELDWLAAARVHPLDQLVTRGFSLLPVFTLGFSDVAISAYMMIYALQTVLVHSNLRINFGPFRWLLTSPEFHHWHHSRDREARDKNFAGMLPLLDVMFGTSYMPPGHAPSKYGLDQQIPATCPAQLLYPFRGILMSEDLTSLRPTTKTAFGILLQRSGTAPVEAREYRALPARIGRNDAMGLGCVKTLCRKCRSVAILAKWRCGGIVLGSTMPSSPL